MLRLFESLPALVAAVILVQHMPAFISQDQKSCIVYGMPKQAAKTGHVNFILNPERIRDKLVELVGVMG